MNSETVLCVKENTYVFRYNSGEILSFVKASARAENVLKHPGMVFLTHLGKMAADPNSDFLYEDAAAVWHEVTSSLLEEEDSKVV